MLHGCLSRRGGDSSFSKDLLDSWLAEAGWFLICSNRPAIPLWVLTLVSHPHCCLALPQLTLLRTVPLCFAFLTLLSYVMAFGTHFQLLPCSPCYLDSLKFTIKGRFAQGLEETHLITLCFSDWHT